jgi:alpha/beta superfamily hydrolase
MEAVAAAAPGLIDLGLEIRSGAGRLSGVLSHLPAMSPRSGVLVLGPHPRFGGDMENNVVRALARVLARRGHAALRFDYRGVGRSEGPFRDALEAFRYWSSVLESDAYDAVLDDARAARDSLLRLTSEVHVVGYSFGAVLALRLAAEDPRPVRAAALCLAVGEYRLDFLGRVRAPVLALHPQSDFATPAALVEEKLSAVGSPRRLAILAGADHFLRGREEEAAALVAAFLEDGAAAPTAGGTAP